MGYNAKGNIYIERRQQRASSLVNAKSRSNTGPVCCLLPFGCPFFIPSLTVPSSLSLSIPAKASVQRLIYSQLCGRSLKNLSHVTVKVKGPWQAVAICALTLKAHLYLREKEWERENHAWRERESCLLSPCDMDRFVLWGLLLNINVCGCDRSRVFHPTEQTAAHRSRVARLTLSLKSTTKNTRILSIVMVSLKTARRSHICNSNSLNIA